MKKYFTCHLGGEAYTGQLIEALLRAMKHGSVEARRLFPCLLQLPLRNYADVFSAEVSDLVGQDHCDRFKGFVEL